MNDNPFDSRKPSKSESIKNLEPQKYPSDFIKLLKRESIKNSEYWNSSNSIELASQNDFFHTKDLRKKFFVNAFEDFLEKKIANKHYFSSLDMKQTINLKDNPSNLPKNLSTIQKIINNKKNRKQMKVPSKMDKFEKKMQIFKGLNSFIDISDFLLESNLTNYANSEELLVKLKLHYKDSLNNILKNELSSSDFEELGKSESIFGSTSLEKSTILNSHFLKKNDVKTFESKMRKIKETIEHSKETINELKKQKILTQSDFDDENSNNLLATIYKKMEEINKETILETNVNETKNQDLIFHDSLKKIEKQFNFNKKFLFSRPNKNQQISPLLAENRKKHNDEEINQLDKFIKKVMFKGVVDEKGDYIPETKYLDEFKNQYTKIKTVLRKVTKNIFRKEESKFPQNRASINSNSQLNMNKVINSKNDLNSQDKNFFLTNSKHENPYMLNDRRSSTYFIDKNKQEATINGYKSLSPRNESLKSIKNRGTIGVRSTKENLQTSKILKLNLPNLSKFTEKKSFFNPYVMKDSSRKNSAETNANYKQENKAIHNKFERLLKNIDKMESTQKFKSDNLKDDMADIIKEMNKLNHEKCEFTSIRDIDSNSLLIPSKNLSLKGFRKAKKKIQNLKL